MKGVVLCEESQTVCKAFRELGHDFYSNDLKEASGGHQEWHIKGDAIDVLYSQKWDIVIAHPPCTRLCNSGVTWLEERNLWNELYEAKKFFYEFKRYGEKGNKIAIENPIPHKYAVTGEYGIGKYSQIIQPWQFGHGETKATCLWLYGLPKLIPTNIVEGREQRLHKLPPGPERATLRSKTYEGIAKAMAYQFSNIYQLNLFT